MMYHFRPYDVLQSRNGKPVDGQPTWLDFCTIKTVEDVADSVRLVDTGRWDGKVLEFRIVRYRPSVGSVPVYWYWQTEPYKSPRTFGELFVTRHSHISSRCSFCKRDMQDEHYEGARSYSTRHRICDDCILERYEVVLPAVRRAEAFDKRMRALGQCVDCGQRGERTGHQGCQYPGRHSEA